MIPSPHEFQMNLYHRVHAQVARGNRIIVVQGATGCGKTTWASYAVKQAVARITPTLLMVNRRRLVDQLSARLFDFEIDHSVFMRGETRDARALVQVASRDTLLSRCMRNQWTGLPPAKLVLVDEGHHAANPESEYRRILGNYPEAVILLLTATPVGPDGQGLGPWAQAIECAAPTSQLIRDGFLVPVKCYAPDRKTRNGKVRRGIAGDLVESWQSYGEGLPTVLFCARVAHSQDAVEAFIAAGIPAAHVDASTPDDERDEIFDGLETGKVKVVSNVGIIREGVDIPCLGCCQFYMNPPGRVAFLQGCGRIMRPFPGKTHGVLIDHAGAVFHHGFPDEDTEWTLMGNADVEFSKKHEAGLTEAVLYCKHCEMVYHGSVVCPECGRAPVKPPRSVFAPEPVEATHELLTEADRVLKIEVGRQEKIQHWYRCLGVARKRNGTFGMAAQVYRQKYKEWPKDDFPLMPPGRSWKAKVAEYFPAK